MGADRAEYADAMLGYFGPAGTFTHQALLSLGMGDGEPFPTVGAALDAVASGEVEAALVPIENSVEGGVSATLDRLAAEEVLRTPKHPYTRGLLDSVPANNEGGARLRQIPGMTPSLARLPRGCAFRERCGFADSVCFSEPEFKSNIRCHHPLC